MNSNILNWIKSADPASFKEIQLKSKRKMYTKGAYLRATYMLVHSHILKQCVPSLRVKLNSRIWLRSPRELIDVSSEGWATQHDPSLRALQLAESIETEVAKFSKTHPDLHLLAEPETRFWKFYAPNASRSLGKKPLKECIAVKVFEDADQSVPYLQITIRKGAK